MRTMRVIGRRTAEGIADVLVISTVAWCHVCLSRRLFVRLTEWQGIGVHGQCASCGNGQKVQMGPPERPAA